MGNRSRQLAPRSSPSLISRVWPGVVVWNDACGGREQPIARLRCGASDRGGCASVPNARSARPDARDISARDPHFYAAEDIRFGMRYTHAATKEEDGTPVLDPIRIGVREPDIGECQEQGWTEREEERE